jgi:outer membrane receptor protein involved in Fe transport
MRYRLSLFSNFTYFLDNPMDGDQFEQRDSRTVLGGAASRSWRHTLAGAASRTEVGVQLRQDRINVGLYDTVAQRRTGTTREDRVRETSAGVYVENQTEWPPWFRTVAGLRTDAMRFDVASDLRENSGVTHANRVSPKLSAIFGPWAETEFFVNAGQGFHSNDARGTTTRVDPKSGLSVDPVPGMVGTRGGELGLRTEWVPGLQSSLSLWALSAKSELVYVGDAGTTEANRPSRRRGVEWSNRWVPAPWLLFDADLAWTHARFKGDDPAGDRIPGAVERAASVAVTLRDLAGWSASLQWRYLGARPLVEDNSVRARSTLLTNLRVARKLTPKVDLTVDVFNLLNRKVNDIEYYYASQLRGEAAPVNDAHVHPGEPRSVRVTLQMRF